MDQSTGQIVALLVSLLSAILDLLNITGVAHVDAATRAALVAVLTAAVPAGLLLWAYLHHQTTLLSRELGLR